MTNASDYTALIKKRITERENYNDIVEMIEILATERIKNLPQKKRLERDRHYDFAAKVLCIIFDIFKEPDYVQAIVSLRLRFSGIRNSDTLRSLFKRSLSQTLLTEPDDRKIIQDIKTKGLEIFFRTV